MTKPTNNPALKLAIFTSGKRQMEIARRADIHPTILSRIVNGRLPPTDEQRAALARVLRKRIDELFPEAVAS